MNHKELLQWLRDCKINYRGNRPYIWEVMQLLLKEIDALKTRLDKVHIEEENAEPVELSLKEQMKILDDCWQKSRFISIGEQKKIDELKKLDEKLPVKEVKWTKQPSFPTQWDEVTKPDLLQAAKDLSKKDKRDIWDD